MELEWQGPAYTSTDSETLFEETVTNTSDSEGLAMGDPEITFVLDTGVILDSTRQSDLPGNGTILPTATSFDDENRHLCHRQTVRLEP